MTLVVRCWKGAVVNIDVRNRSVSLNSIARTVYSDSYQAVLTSEFSCTVFCGFQIYSRWFYTVVVSKE